MKIILGLGNPGLDYVGTRHNVGVMLVDYLADLPVNKSSYGWRKHFDALVYKTPALILVKTKSVFMNESGRLLQGLPEGELYVVHDDLDLRLGEYKIQMGVGPKLHYGVQSVENVLGRRDFWRIRIGVDNRDPNNRISGEEYVLQKLFPEEKENLSKVFEEICNKLI